MSFLNMATATLSWWRMTACANINTLAISSINMESVLFTRSMISNHKDNHFPDTNLKKVFRNTQRV